MKDKLITVMNTLVVFIPWTILPIRMFDWALKSPNAENIILGYAIFMIIGGIFTILTYSRIEEKSNLLKICLIVNSFYLCFGLFALGMVLFQ
ncbi:hypothetical protein [Tetragenococcus halophilus]|uniref:Uncharacterized protein n=2 Tax=Tetragenococcus halophilus TaxID=51669 RepID=A0A2H6CV97_TETHA|nr:hypothetical protein [Tetragenococcus halophilus]MDN6140005.1 hypothetical protein [Tetragenococcus koreensis]MDN6640696.1 hypothetical protein [Tetragenococcus sp.]MDN6748872.1 hypothetical protein [Staphylococcus equorum]MDN6835304.1 hypothetical protein [Lactococcus lactis]MCF1602278.1 hypothetical protein [Tetragenococcus halophilus]